jgi:hypothetical protein
MPHFAETWVWVCFVFCLCVHAQAQSLELSSVQGTHGIVTKEHPDPPQITYRNGRLTIRADNSTLGEILSGVRSTTGAGIQFPAAAANERATVRLGPGSITNVLAALVEGSPFDYMIIGSDQQPENVHAVLWGKSIYPEISDSARVDGSRQDAVLAGKVREVPVLKAGQGQLSGGQTQFVAGQPPSEGSVSSPDGEAQQDTQPQKAHREERPRVIPLKKQ